MTGKIIQGCHAPTNVHAMTLTVLLLHNLLLSAGAGGNHRSRQWTLQSHVRHTWHELAGGGVDNVVSWEVYPLLHPCLLSACDARLCQTAVCIQASDAAAAPAATAVLEPRTSLSSMTRQQEVHRLLLLLLLLQSCSPAVHMSLTDPQSCMCPGQPACSGAKQLRL